MYSVYKHTYVDTLELTPLLVILFQTVTKLVTKLVGQYFDVAALRKRFQVFINKHFNVWGKYGVPLSVNHVFVNTP